jgi:glycosyltransferase involved in cell wall biosynthesis
MDPACETLLIAGSREEHEEDGLPIARSLDIDPVIIPEMGRSINPIHDWTAYQSLRKQIREYRPHIVHTHAAKPGALGRLAAEAEGVPVIIHTFHGHVFHSYFNPIKNQVFQRIERYLATKSDAIIAISPEQKKELSEDFRIAPADKFRVIPLGFDLDKFAQDQSFKRNQFRKELGVDANTVVITLTGRLVPIKNHVFFLRAFKQLNQLTEKKILAVFVGDGESRASIESEAQALGILFASLGNQSPETELIFTSWRTDIDVVNAGSDIVALSSLNEGTPVSLIEALAAERPVVSTRVGGVESIVEHGVSGFLCDKTDVESFAQHLAKLVNDESLRQRMGQTGAEHVRTNYTYQRLVKDVSELYRELLNNKGVKPN